MKIAKQDEYGLRIMLRIAQAPEDSGISIAQLSEDEGLSVPYVGKLTRNLRMGGLINSTRGKNGGYVLARPAQEIKIAEVLEALDGALFDKDFCGSHTGTYGFCTNSVDCSVRSLWRVVQSAVDQIVMQVTVHDLLAPEENTQSALKQYL